MPERRYHHLVLYLCMVLLSLAPVGCAIPASTVTETSQPNRKYEVGVSFREFYQLLGGNDVLGTPISETFQSGDLTCQYTENVLMQYDPLATGADQFSLAPLGADLDLQDDPITAPEQDKVRIVDGYIIYENFVDLYDALQGVRFAGKPLSQVHVNNTQNRIEQYFENVGFYQNLDDETGNVHLFAYGTWKCAGTCRQIDDPLALVSPSKNFPEPFYSSLTQIGADLTGSPLSQPYQADDGSIEQIYENLVIYANPASLDNVSLRSITAQVGYASTEPSTKVDDSRMVFYPTQGDLGYNIPTIFDDYIALHGGYEISGVPTTEIFEEGSIWRQCFLNYCLDYDPDAAEDKSIRPAPLGALYLSQNPPAAAVEAKETTPDKQILLSMTKLHTLIDTQTEQQISITLKNRENGAPFANITAVLTVTHPDSIQHTQEFPPTNDQGQASLTISAIDAANGTLIPFQVCAAVGEEKPECDYDSYLIWENN